MSTWNGLEQDWNEELLERSPDIFRTAAAIVLSTSEALACTKAALSELRNATPAADPLPLILAHTWRACSHANPQGPALFPQLASLTPEQRAVLIAVDVLGLLPTEVTEALNLSEEQVLTHLAVARRHLARSA